MRIAVVGKGGMGKSVVAGTLARLAGRAGERVLVLDSDPLPGLAFSLGSGPESIAPPLLEAVRRDEEGRWGWRPGLDAVCAAERYSTPAPDGVRVLGCRLAPGTAKPVPGATNALWEIAHGLVDAAAFRDWTLIGDLPAGARQPADDWAPYARTILVLVQPTVQSALTGRRIARLVRAGTRGADVAFLANQAGTPQDVAHVEAWVGEPVLAALPPDAALAAAERLGVAPIDHAPGSPAVLALERLRQVLAERQRA